MVSKLAWAATFLSVVIVDVDFGLYVGIGFALLLFIIQKQRYQLHPTANC